MKPIRGLLIAALLLLSPAAGHAELSVASYVEVTIARLDLAATAWRDTGQPPPAEELDELYQSHGIDREAYLCFAGEKSREIEAYLEEHPELRDTIDSLSAEIRREIARGEDD